MADNRNLKDDCTVINDKTIVPVCYSDSNELHAVKMAHDGHIVITRPDLVKPGLKLGDWSQVEK